MVAPRYETLRTFANPSHEGRGGVPPVGINGTEWVIDLPQWYASEDFAFYTQRMPGVFYVLGTGNEMQD